MDGGGSVKKTRGRPRKYGPMLDLSTPTPQKKRGRPRKQRLADELSPSTVGGNELPLSVHTVVSNDDLLNEILVRLPVVSLVLFKSVSKRWLSLIKDATFIKRRSRIPNIDPPSGLFIERDLKTNVCTYCSVPFDIRIPSGVENIIKTGPRSSTTILQSCNGLFLCSVMPGYRFCVYNPTVNLFKMLPEPLYYEVKQFSFTSMDFDPTKSPHYKVVHATPLSHDCRFEIQTYSSETGIWSIVCSCSDPIEDLRKGIYWNDAIHWINRDYDRRLHYKLDFWNKTVVLTKIQLPVTMDTVNNYCKLFESRDCLLLLGMDKTHPRDQLNIYAMSNGHPEWTFKYFVNDLRNRHPEWTFKYFVNNWSTFKYIRRVLCIALGEREEDSFMVIKLDGMVVLYKFVLKTFCELPELESMLTKRGEYFLGEYFPSTSSFLFTASFASV